MAGLLLIALIALVSALGPFIRPDATPDANDQSLVLSRLKPGSSVTEIRIKNNTPEVGIWREWLDGGKAKNHLAIPVDSISCNTDSITYWMKEQANNKGVTIAASELQKHSEGDFLFHRTFYLGTDKYVPVASFYSMRENGGSPNCCGNRVDPIM